jgi:hypothetical protein
MKKPIEIQKTHAQCWVCLEHGIKKEYPIDELIYLTQGQYRCRKHRGSTILAAGQKHEQERTARRWVIS